MRLLDEAMATEQTLLRCLVDAMETMAFLTPEPSDEPPPSDFTGLRTVHVAFKGAISGRMTLAATAEFTVNLAANVLGCDAADPESALRAQDAFKELANVVAGLTLRRLKAHVELAVPKIDGDDRPYERIAGGETCRVALLADGQPIAALLELETTSPA